MGRLLGLALGCAVVASGCYLSHELAVPDDSGAPPDVGPSDVGPPDGAVDAPADAPADAPLDVTPGCDGGPTPDAGGADLRVDLLFVIDDSGSMVEEQEALATQFPVMVRILATGDLDEDGRPDVQPVGDLSVGVITTNLGSGGFDLGFGCEIREAEGADGVLRVRAEGEGCPGTIPRFLRFQPASGAPVERFVSDFACLARVGRRGCGFEQPLEAALKALLPSASPVTFLSGTGRGDTDNAGFVRDGALLAVIVVSDEDDCSVADPELFDPESPRYPRAEGTPGNRRCSRYPEALFPVSRFVEGLRLVKEDPRDVVFAAITGVPPDRVEDAAAVDYEALLADERMQNRPDPRPLREDFLLPACDLEGVGFALPARRTVEVAQGFGDNGVVQSICNPSFADALRGITSRLGEVIRRRRCR